MTDHENDKSESSREDGRVEEDDDPQSAAVRALLKRSLAVDKSPSLLPGVQRRIRRRSRGKFFADGWSTTHTRVSPVLIGLVTLLIAALAYFALGPSSVH